jgi:hypothetical protein
MGLTFKKYEYTALQMWSGRMVVKFAITLDDSENRNANYRSGSYVSKKTGEQIGYVDLACEALMIIKYVPISSDKRTVFGEVWIPPRKIQELRRLLQEVYDSLYDETQPSFGTYSDGTVMLTAVGQQKTWYLSDLPLQRHLRIMLCAAPDTSGKINTQPGVLFQIQNRESASLLPWDDFLALKHLIDNLQMEMITPMLMNMLYYENLLEFFRGVKNG